MKTILLLATIMLLSQSCTKQDMEMEQKRELAPANKMLADDFPGKIISVYFQGWVSGVRGGGSGTNFYIELAEPLPEGVKMSKVYFRGQKEPITPINKMLYEARFPNNRNNGNEDILLSKNETIVNVVHSLPVDDTEAELVYYEDNVLKLYLLSDLKEIPPLFYP